MKKRLILGAVAIGICAVALVITLRSLYPDSISTIDKVSDRGMATLQGATDARSNKEQRLTEMKAKLSTIAAMPKPPPPEDITGWEGVPPGLDALLEEEPADPEGTLLTLSEAQKFVQKQMLNGTTVTAATCSKSLCRISFVHTDAETCKNYERHLVFSPWADASNYFTNEIEKDGTVESVIWEGRDGFTLPLEALRQENATGKYAKP